MPLRVIDLGLASAVASQAAGYGIADALAPGGEPAVVLADPIEPFLSVGANQDIERGIDLSFCCRRGIRIIRRRLGGGAIYIDRDQLMFHIIVPLERAPRPASRMLRTLAAPVIDTCRDLGIAAELRPPGETLTVLATDPVATIDFPYYCHHAGLELISTTRQAEVLIFEIRKPARPVPLAPNRPIG